MVQRTPPRRKQDESAFPVRVRIVNPWQSCGSLRWGEAEVWLRATVGGGNWAVYGEHIREFHFRTVEAAQAFRDAFPDLELADRTDQVDHLLQQRAYTKRPRPDADLWSSPVYRSED